MKWFFHWGDRIQFYDHLQQRDKLRSEDKEPVIEPFTFFIEAFLELDTCRGVGFDISPIPFTSIVEYAKIYEVEDTEEFVYLIRSMDNTYIRLNKSKRKSSNATNRNDNQNNHNQK